jgi:hypothetical protein
MAIGNNSEHCCSLIRRYWLNRGHVVAAHSQQMSAHGISVHAVVSDLRNGLPFDATPALLSRLYTEHTTLQPRKLAA